MKTRTLLINSVITLSLLLAAGGMDFARAQQGSSTASAPAMNWARVSEYSFGLSDNFIGAVTALEVFDGVLYAGPTSRSSGTLMFRSDDGLTWLINPSSPRHLPAAALEWAGSGSPPPARQS